MYFYEDNKFKLGDLVRVTKNVVFVTRNNLEINAGEVGLVVSVFPDDSHFVSFWGVDYIVLIRGIRLLFFEEELELVKSGGTIMGGLEFIYLKKG